jgi:hypothetical protein
VLKNQPLEVSCGMESGWLHTVLSYLLRVM